MDNMRRTILLASLAALCAGAGVVPTVTEIEFPTYGFSDPDPVPCTDSPLYPYFRFDGSTDKAATLRFTLPASGFKPVRAAGAADVKYSEDGRVGTLEIPSGGLAFLRTDAR